MRPYKPTTVVYQHLYILAHSQSFDNMGNKNHTIPDNPFSQLLTSLSLFTVQRLRLKTVQTIATAYIDVLFNS